MKHRQRSLPLLSLIFRPVSAAPPAFASAIIGRDVTRPTLTIDSQGRAHVSYFANGHRNVLVAWGAINARTPRRTVPQANFQLRYGQGGGGVCLPYDGPPLALLVKACKAPDGSYL